MKRLTVLAMLALVAQAQDFQQSLWAMTASHHQWPVSKAPVVSVQKPQAVAQRELDPVEREALRNALERGARCATGKLVKDTASGLWVPELKTNCR